ncbi:unnamed protein product [marine sediment metagenome]|uniref:Uncharacterized protein n=1 Tax=marine sediment metagenome TaxID=412755 RepID=X1RWF1_9ZZZZ
MEQEELIAQAGKLMAEACAYNVTGAEEKANASLAKLRELLDAQPELEAGGG